MMLERRLELLVSWLLEAEAGSTANAEIEDWLVRLTVGDADVDAVPDAGLNHVRSSLGTSSSSSTSASLLIWLPSEQSSLTEHAHGRRASTEDLPAGSPFDGCGDLIKSRDEVLAQKEQTLSQLPVSQLKCETSPATVK
jgi:hypothetical protein